MPFFDQYPYTNFHNVNLDWVLERVKEWGALVEQNNIAFQNLEQANEDFKNYVTSYLENLDVQAQIDDKLDRMFESGELTDYLQPYVSSTVTTWLDENITEPAGVVIDASLTVAGACADAKSAGDKILANTLSILSNGITGDIRDAILQCFNNVAWVNTQGQLFYNYLKNALSKVAFTKMHWNTITDNEVCKSVIQKVAQPDPIDGVQTCLITTSVNRGSVFLNTGYSSVLNRNLTDSGYYLIPIPENANSFKISSPNTDFLFWTHQRRYAGNAHIFVWIADDASSVGINNPYISNVKSYEGRGRANMICIFIKKRDDSQINELPEIDILFME